MVSFFSRKLRTAPHGLTIVGRIWGPVAGGIDEALVLSIGHRMQRQIVPWQIDAEGGVTR
jgi:hypothetical protein